MFKSNNYNFNFVLCIKNEFRDYPQLLREAISLGRRMQDPLVEFSQLCTTDDEILCLRYHQYQVIIILNFNLFNFFFFLL